MSVPGLANWDATDEDYAEQFASLPVEFAKAYLSRRVRDFLYETFCFATQSNCDSNSQSDRDSNSAADLLANDRVGGGIQIGLVQQFDKSNYGQGYFDLGWQILRQNDDGSLAVAKEELTVCVQRDRHLSTHQRSAEVGQTVSILLPSYRYEPEYYVAIGNLGPVLDIDAAVEIYFAATPQASVPIMAAVTQLLNGVHTNGSSDRPLKAVPYTLKVPFQTEGYEGAECVSLRVKNADYEQVLPCLKQIVELIYRSHIRAELPLFARSLYPGISIASVVKSSETQWFGSAVDLSRLQLAAEALVSVWYRAVDAVEQASSYSPLPVALWNPDQKLAAIRAKFAQAQLSLSMTYGPVHSAWYESGPWQQAARDQENSQ